MNGYINPQIFAPENPVGLDKEFFKLQIDLADSNIIEKVFGRAHLQKDLITRKGFDSETRRDTVGRTTILAPYSYLKNEEPINLMPNDNVKSQSFFQLNDQERITDEGPLVKTFFASAPCSLILWGNINFMSEGSPEEVKIKILEILKRNPKLILKETYQSFDQIFSRYTITDNMINYNKLPYFGIRFDFKIDYVLTPENCK
jgi:hypothetical protein